MIVDGTYKTAEGADPEAGDEEKAPMEYVARTAEEMETYRNLVAKAIEFDADRGDQIEVQNVQFSDEDTELAEAQLRAAEMRDAVRFWTRMGIVLVVALEADLGCMMLAHHQDLAVGQSPICEKL